MAPGQAPTVVSRPKTFGEGSRVRAMRENAVSIIKQRRLVTLVGTIDFHIQKYHTSRYKTAGIAIKFVYGSLLALESF